MTIKFILMSILVTIITGWLFNRTYDRFMDGTIKQASLEYQICGYAALNVFIMSLIVSIGSILTYIIELLFSI